MNATNQPPQPSPWVRMSELVSTPDKPGLTPAKSRTTIHTWIKRGAFPAGVVLGTGITAWRESVVLDWLEQREAEGAKKSARGGKGGTKPRAAPASSESVAAGAA